MPPPTPVAVFPESVLLATVRLPVQVMPPPGPAAELVEIVLPVTVRVPVA